MVTVDRALFTLDNKQQKSNNICLFVYITSTMQHWVTLGQYPQRIAMLQKYIKGSKRSQQINPFIIPH